MRDIPVIFIVGASRSGTTMLNHVLGENSNVLGLNELHFIDRKWWPEQDAVWDRDRAVREAAELLATARRSVWKNRPSDAEFKEAGAIVEALPDASINPLDVYEATLYFMIREAGNLHVVDQTPRNVFFAGQLLREFPNSHVIQIVRDPRAVIFSQRNRWRQRWLGASHTPLASALRVWVNYHPITASRLWRRAFEAGQAVAGQARFLQIRFEDLVTAPETCIRMICDRLDIEFDPCMLDAPKIGSSNQQHDGSSIGITAEVADKWYGRQSPADTWICQKMTAKARRDMGYDSVVTGLPIVGISLRLLLFPLHLLGVLLVNPRLATRVRSAMLKAPVKEH